MLAGEILEENKNTCPCVTFRSLLYKLARELPKCTPISSKSLRNTETRYFEEEEDDDFVCGTVLWF